MQVRKTIMCACVAVLLVSTSRVSNAREISIAKAVGFSVRLEIDDLRDTELGSKLIQAIRAMAAEEIGGDKHPDEAFQEIEKALGFDPFEEVRSVTIIGLDFEDPFEGIRLVVELGKTTGNLEGLLLALPGYESSKHGDYLIHSVSPDDGLRIFGAIHTTKADAKQVVVSTSLDGIKSMLKSIDEGGSPSNDEVSLSADSDALVSVRLNKMPEMDDLDGPPAVIAKLLERASLTIREKGDDFSINISLKTDDEKHAEQIQQLAQGLVAMVALWEESADGDQDLKMIAEVVNELEVARDGTTIDLRVELPHAMVIDFLREVVDLPIAK